MMKGRRLRRLPAFWLEADGSADRDVARRGFATDCPPAEWIAEPREPIEQLVMPLRSPLTVAQRF